MADNYFPLDNNGLANYPGPSQVILDTAVVGVLGQMVVSVAGYGQVPAAANKDTGLMRGVIRDTDGTTGDQTAAHVVEAWPGVGRFLNDGTHPCAQADVGAKVYASDGTHISKTAADGPLAGTLIEFNSADPMGRPCRVALRCFQT